MGLIRGSVAKYISETAEYGFTEISCENNILFMYRSSKKPNVTMDAMTAIDIDNRISASITFDILTDTVEDAKLILIDKIIEQRSVNNIHESIANEISELINSGYDSAFHKNTILMMTKKNPMGINYERTMVAIDVSNGKKTSREYVPTIQGIKEAMTKCINDIVEDEEY